MDDLFNLIFGLLFSLLSFAFLIGFFYLAFKIGTGFVNMLF